jgi:hypothetical protein
MSDVLAHKTRTCPYCGAPIKPGVNTAIKRDGLASLRDVAGKTELVAPAPGQAVAAARPTTSGQAVASFLFAVLGAGLGAIPALVLGARARREIQWSGRHIGGLRWAVAGQVLGGIQLAVLVVIALILLWNGGEERALPPTPDGPLPVTQVFAEDGLVSDVSARKSGDLVSVSFTLRMRADECKAYALPDHGQRVAGLLEPGVHTITITRSGSATEAYLSCNRPLEDLIAQGRNAS